VKTGPITREVALADLKTMSVDAAVIFEGESWTDVVDKLAKVAVVVGSEDFLCAFKHSKSFGEPGAAFSTIVRSASEGLFKLFD